MKTMKSIVFMPFCAMCFGLTLYSCYNPEINSDETKYPELTTVDRTIVAEKVTSRTKPSINDPASFEEYGFGKWHYGPGLPYDKRLDLMPAGYSLTSTQSNDKLLRFFAITDIHITDEETPASGIVFYSKAGNNGISCYTPQTLYSTQVLDAAIYTANVLNKVDPMDFGIALGDMVNSAQYNEMRWFIDVMDGKKVKPDSGIKDDPIPGPHNDYQDEFQSVGLDKEIPWYAAIGNHDHFWMGVKPVNDRVRKSVISENIFTVGNILKDPNAMNDSLFVTGTIDGSTPYGTIIGVGIRAQMQSIPKIPADAKRRFLSKNEVIQEMSTTLTLPVGHGFIQTKSDNVFNGCYSFEPKSDLPLKVIVLDDTQDESEIRNDIYGYGTLENGRHDWLIRQLEAGQKEGKLMIIAAHIPIGVAPGQPVGWYDMTVESNLVEELKTYPNLLLWISGHRHLNNVKAFPSSDTNHPENSFWEVETKSLREFPQQFRTFDVMLNKDNTISIFATDVDPIIRNNPFAALSRFYAIAANQIYGLEDTSNPNGEASYNVELVKQLTPEMQAKIRSYVRPR